MYFIAWLHGVPVGHLDLHWPGYGGNALERLLPDYCELNAIVVVPAWQSHGIGTALIAAAEAQILAQGMTTACLGVSTDNPRAQALYERLGYSAWEHGVVEESWTVTDEQGQEQPHSEQVIYLVKAITPENHPRP